MQSIGYGRPSYRRILAKAEMVTLSAQATCQARIKGQFEYRVGAKVVGFSQGDFCLVVQALHDPAGNQFLRPEIVEDQFT
jgi:hypothetical protein